MKHILIVRSSPAVGDLILTLPVLSALQNHYTGLSIDVMGNSVLTILKKFGYVDNILPIDSRAMTPLFMKNTPLPGATLQNLQSYDAVISFLPNSTGIFEENLRRITNAPVHTGSAHPVCTDRLHITHVLMKSLVPLGIAPIAEVPKLRIPASAKVENTQFVCSDKLLFAVHPGSGGSEKCWPAGRYVTLIKALISRDYHPVVIFGPADKKIRSQIVPCLKEHEVQIIENRPLVDLIPLLSRCYGMVGNDSGITHLAAALGTPVIALFGPTDPAVWGQRGTGVRILWGGKAIKGDVGKMIFADAFYNKKLTDINLESIMNALATFP